MSACRTINNELELNPSLRNFITKTWNTENPSLGSETDLNQLCVSLNCTTLNVESQDLHNIDISREWGFGGFAYLRDAG